MRTFFVAIPLLMLASTIASADCAVRAERAYISEPPPGAGVAAAYFILTNDCHAPEAVIAAESEASPSISVSLHRSTIKDGVARMEPVDRIPIRANDSVTFAAGGLHVMLRGREFKAGESFQFDLVLEDGDRVRVFADVVHGTLSAHHAAEIDPREHQKHHPGGVE